MPQLLNCLAASLRSQRTCAGDAFLVVTGSSQPKIFDRDGHELGQSVKGDMYIRDLKNTKGHQYRCCSGQWHPTDKYEKPSHVCCSLCMGAACFALPPLVAHQPSCAPQAHCCDMC